MRIGILSLQGAVSEHEVCISNLGIDTVTIRSKNDFREVSGIIMPGGESTTLRKLLINSGLWEILKESDIPIMGTCAGAILIGKNSKNDLGKIDIKIDRNYYGRQKESFQKKIEVKGNLQFNGIFIRAPAITSIGNGVEAIAWENNQIVGCMEKKNMALTFHPELTDNPIFHKMWLEKLS